MKRPEEKLISVSPEVHEKLKALAKANGRTMRGQLEFMLQQEEAKRG